MSTISNDRRKFLITHPDQEVCNRLIKGIENRVPRAQFYTAHDALTCTSMLSNDAPDVVVINESIHKQSAISIIEELLKDKKLNRTAAIILSEVPNEEYFVDEVVVGRIQFLSDWENGELFSKALIRSLNFVSKDEPKTFRLRHLSPDELLIDEGSKAKFVYFVKEGQLRATAHKDGKAIVLGDINPGEFAGEMAYINHTPRSADVTALTECVLIEIPIDLLDHVLFQKPAWVKALMKTLSKRVSELNEKLKT